jgi:N-acetyl-anhydromuramyl-L-alanine amidase AmpD
VKIIVVKNPLRSKPRPASVAISGIILHSTDGWSATSSIAWQRLTGTSYTYIIERDGTAYKCVPISQAANHAGSSYGWREELRGVSRAQNSVTKKFKAGCSVNSYTIGIAFANRESKGEQLTQAQLDAAMELIQILVAADKGGHLKYVSTHYAVSPKRKFDPAMLPIKELRKLAELNGLRLWGITKGA